MKKKILALLVTFVTILLLIFSSPISAKIGNDSPESGYETGDNHPPGGPPGHNDNIRPGWGKGDEMNHEHTGPYGYGYRHKID
jgi:hypothetical protein